MCTSLLYTDALNKPYLGRTLELSLELPYLIAYYPVGQAMVSAADGYPSTQWDMRHAVMAVTMPDKLPTGAAFTAADLKIVEGINDAGLTFSVQSYPQVGNSQHDLTPAKASVSAIDLGAYILGQYATIADLKSDIDDLQVVVESVAILGGLHMPFHYSLHDATGASLVIEFHNGVRTVYDNPVGVMTNAPQFSWHLTNLNNYTFLSNIDKSKAQFMGYEAEQPGSGIAKAGLPVTDNSVDRFIRAVFYANFAEKQTDADQSVQMVAHIMNNFDRPRGITTDPKDVGSGHLEVAGLDLKTVPTEFTSWTSISDIDRKKLYLRDSRGMNYFCLDLAQYAGTDKFISKPMKQLTPNISQVSLA